MRTQTLCRGSFYVSHRVCWFIIAVAPSQNAINSSVHYNVFYVVWCIMNGLQTWKRLEGVTRG